MTFRKRQPSNAPTGDGGAIVALDLETARLLDERATRLGLSQAAVVRKALESLDSDEAIRDTPELRVLVDELHRSAERAEAAIDAAEQEIAAYLAEKKARSA